MVRVGQSYKLDDRVVFVEHLTECGRFARVGDGSGGNKLAHIDTLGSRVPRVYIAGPMTGLPELNFPAFHAAAADYRKRGCHVENPAEINPDPSMEWADAMRADIPRLLTCDTIVLLPGWGNSRGALLELHIAREVGMAITWADGTTGEMIA